MAASNEKFFEEDLVIKNSQKIEVGEVVETAEFLNSDDEDEVDAEGRQSMKKGHIRVEWPDRSGSVEKIALYMLDLNPDEGVLPERKVKLYDRQLYKGQIVRRAGSEEDQLGYCRSTSVTADVQVVGTQHVLTNVKSTDLEKQKDSFWVRFYDFFFDMSLKGWRFPMIFSLLRISMLLLPRMPPRVGAHALLKMKDSYNAVPLSDWKTLLAAKLNISSRKVKTPGVMSWAPAKLYIYGFGYLWMTLCFLAISMHFHRWCNDSNVWSEGLNGTPFEFLGRFFNVYCWFQIFKTIVQSKTLKEVCFDISLCIFSFRGLLGTLLRNLLEKLNEYLMENIKYLAVNLGEWYFNFLGYFFSCYCLFKSIEMLVCIVRRGLRRSLRDFSGFLFFWREKELVPEEELTVEIIVTRTRADVVWQDGTVEQDIPSTKLCPAWDMWNEHEYFPGNHVLGSEGSFADFPSHDYGVVKKVDHPGRTATVEWMKTNDADGHPHPEVVAEQEVSTYDIIRHPESGRDLISVSNPEPSAEDGPSENDSIATDDESPSEDPPLVPQEGTIEGKKEGANDSYPATPHAESGNMCQQPCAIPESSLPRLEMPCSELGSMTDGEHPINFEKQPKDVTERNETVNEDLLEGTREKQSMPRMDPPGQGVLIMVDSVPDSHKYKLSTFQPYKLGAFASTVKKEMDILKSSLPDGIVVKCFEDRMDLFSVLIKGPKMTPYEDGLFFFDLQLPADYPNSPPLCHYVSYCKGRLNPNLYQEGRVCVSLLGTFVGQGTQRWNKETSNLLQVVVSIQGLILVSEPYYNEPGYDREKGTPVGNEKSRLYNEKALLKLVESTIKLIMNPPELFQREISDHFQTSKMVERLERWLEISETRSASENPHQDVIVSKDEVSIPEFPLLPASKGFCLTLKTLLEKLKNIVGRKES